MLADIVEQRQALRLELGYSDDLVLHDTRIKPNWSLPVRLLARHNGFVAIADRADLSRITVTPGQRSGQPCIRGLRVTVWDVLDMLASGMTEDDILRDYPYLEKADFAAVYAFASQAGRENTSR